MTAAAARQLIPASTLLQRLADQLRLASGRIDELQQVFLSLHPGPTMDPTIIRESQGFDLILQMISDLERCCLIMTGAWGTEVAAAASGSGCIQARNRLARNEVCDDSHRLTDILIDADRIAAHVRLREVAEHLRHGGAAKATSGDHDTGPAAEEREIDWF